MYFINGGDETVKRYAVMAGLLLINTLTVYIPIAGVPSTAFTVIYILFMVLIQSIFYSAKREKKILDKYEKESKKSRIRGNIAVLLYVIVSIVAFALVVKSIMPT
jgi:Na+/H+ antiporter NhaD/arsenite permease-like protein